MIRKGTKYCIYSGDVNQDGTVDIADGSSIENDAYNFVSGYVLTDLNGDSFTDVSDTAIADNNAFNLVSKIVPPGAEPEPQVPIDKYSSNKQKK
ncbi:MAG: hypothetical protein M3R36_08945 [Bacteroidota bacterium]|nr:hypothetical protein [Bacteroidota bacterium]